MAGHELSVTRALGHKHFSACGVLWEPSMVQLQLQQQDACLVRPGCVRACVCVCLCWLVSCAAVRALLALLVMCAAVSRTLPWACGVLCAVRSQNHHAQGAVCLFLYGLVVAPLILLPSTHAPQIIASDGVWDVMDAREAGNRVMDVVSGGGSAEAAAQQLVRDTLMLAECSPGGDADNTTALVLVFEAGAGQAE